MLAWKQCVQNTHGAAPVHELFLVILPKFPATSPMILVSEKSTYQH